MHRVRGRAFGIEAARRAGMRAVAICTTHGPTNWPGRT
jgi:beta-phosphoglucomutase-like phosphatase (HAD superfamily)